MRELVFVGIMMFSLSVCAQVGIGTIDPDDSAVLDVQSTTAGVLFPRMSTALRDAIPNPSNGLLIFNTTSNSFQFNVGSDVSPNWVSLESSQTQSGTYDVGATVTGWSYHNVTFANAFSAVPSISLTFREGTGIDNSGSNTVYHFKVANASATGFTIAINDTDITTDVFIDWIATPKTQ